MKPTDILKQEHRHIEQMMDLLDIGVLRLMKGENISAHFFLDALRFFQIFADQCHHNKEEQLLFPAMGEHGFPMQAGPVAVMLYEHEEGRGYIRKLSEAVHKFAQGDSSVVNEINTHASAFTNLLRSHIEKENNIIFEIADAHLPTDVQDSLVRKFNQEEIDGACTQKKSLLEMLEKMKENEQ